jgi:sporulation protein YlmC with PRC-barrel domain
MTSSTINPDTITGVEVTGNGGNKLGTVDDLYIDNETHQPEWVAVRSGLFGTHVCLVPISKAQFDGTVLSVPFGKEQLKTAPRHDPHTDLSPQAEQDLYQHYGLFNRRHSGSAAGHRQHDKPEGQTQPTAAHRRRRLWVNWTLALLTVPAAGLVMLLWLGAVMGTAGCIDNPCRHQGPDESWFGVLYYGAPVVAAVTIALSFYTASRVRGIVVPLGGLLLLAADVAILAISYRP